MDTGRSGFAARRVDAPLRGGTAQTYTFGLLVRVGQAFLPLARQLGGVLVRALLLLPSLVRIEPGAKIRRRQIGELQKKVCEVPFRVDEDAGNAVDGRLFEQGNTQAGFARAGHADDDAMRGQVGRIVHDVLVGQHFAGGQIVFAAQVEARGFLDIEGRRNGVRRPGKQGGRAGSVTDRFSKGPREDR